MSRDRENAADPPRSSSRSSKDATVAIHLEHGRGHHLAYAAIGAAGGLALLVFLGAVGKVVGLLLLIMAAFNGLSAIRTLRREPGTIRVAADRAELPDGLCRGFTHDIPLDEIHSALSLRRALPFGKTGPLLVIETDRGSFAYPRDWFGSESDQKRVENAINRRVSAS